MPANHATNKPTVERAEWVATAVRLASDGWSYRQIGEHIGKHHSTVAEALAKEFERVRPQPEEVETLRAIQREQIQRQMQSWIPRSLNGNEDAALVVYRFMERAAKLDGLDAAGKANLVVTAGGEATPSEAKRIMSELFGGVGPKADPSEPKQDASEPLEE